MIKKIVSLNSKSSFEDIVFMSKNSGLLNQYIMLSNPTNKNEKIIKTAFNLKTHKNHIFIEVKYPLGRRDKRLEIVTRDKNLIKIYKISKLTSADQEALEIDEILTNIKAKYKNSDKEFYGVLVFEQLPVKSVIESISKILSNKITFVQNELIS